MLVILSVCNGISQDSKDGYTKLYYPDGSISSEGILKNGKPDGYWISYYPGGIIKTEGLRINYLLDSTWTFYNNSGNLKNKINYRYGKKNGYSYSYSTKFSTEAYVISKELYLNDNKEDKSFYYHENGTLAEVVNFKKGKREGQSKKYDEKGNLISLIDYHNNFMISREKVNRSDEKGQKQGSWKYFYENEKLFKESYYVDNQLDGLYKEYNEKGGIILILKYEKGKIIEESKEILNQKDLDVKRKFDNDGELSFQGSYKSDVAVGVHRFFDKEGKVINAKIYNDNGIMVSEGILDKTGVKKGVWKNFYNTGELRAKGKYVKNKKSGLWIYYYKNNKEQQEGDYLNGLPDGLWVWYYDSGEIFREESYFNGREDGEMKEYSKDGKIIAEGNFIYGEKEGKWTYNVGDHVEKGSYIAGLREGLWEYFFINGELHFEGKFVQGLAQGKQKYYYLDGSLKEERYYDRGIRERNWKKYDKQGNLFMTISFKNDIEYRINGEKINLPKGSIRVIK